AQPHTIVREGAVVALDDRVINEINLDGVIGTERAVVVAQNVAMRAVFGRHDGSGSDRPLVGANEDAISAEAQVVLLNQVLIAVVVDADGLGIVGLPAGKRLIERS